MKLSHGARQLLPARTASNAQIGVDVPSKTYTIQIHCHLKGKGAHKEEQRQQRSDDEQDDEEAKEDAQDDARQLSPAHEEDAVGLAGSASCLKWRLGPLRLHVGGDCGGTARRWWAAR